MANISKIKLPNIQQPYDIVDSTAVKFTQQQLTLDNKTQAKANIDIYTQSGEPVNAQTGALWLDFEDETDNIVPIISGGTGADNRVNAFNNIVAPGGELTGNITLTQGTRISGDLSDGTAVNLLLRSSDNNVWIGSENMIGAEDQGHVYLGVGENKNIYVKRYGKASQRILDYGFNRKLLLSSATLGSGSITITDGNFEDYRTFIVQTSGSTGALLCVRRDEKVRGGCIFSSAGNRIYLETISFTVSGQTLTYGTSTVKIINTDGTISHEDTGRKITTVWGII